MSIKVQYSSDLHQEFKSADVIPSLLKNINADVLVLAGDICAINTKEDFVKFIALLQYYCPKYKYIIHVAGNHEFYTTTKPVTKMDCMDAVHRKFKALRKNFSNYLYLNCDAVTLQVNNKPYTFIGATLWSKIQPSDWEYVEQNMNDYNCIFINRNNKPVRFTVSEMQKLHAKHKLFIKKAVERAATQNITTIVVTHHKSVEDTPDCSKTKLTQAYETDITYLHKPPVKLVLWGHTHKHYLKSIHGILYASNPKGYPGQHCGFKPDYGITIR